MLRCVNQGFPWAERARRANIMSINQALKWSKERKQKGAFANVHANVKVY